MKYTQFNKVFAYKLEKRAEQEKKKRKNMKL